MIRYKYKDICKSNRGFNDYMNKTKIVMIECILLAVNIVACGKTEVEQTPTFPLIHGQERHHGAKSQNPTMLQSMPTQMIILRYMWNGIMLLQSVIGKTAGIWNRILR